MVFLSVKVSVIVAVHNDESNLSNMLESIKNQTLKDIEVIIIDAASDDGSAEIIKRFLSDKRFRLYKIDVNSFSYARNLGIEKADGKYIAFGDASVIFSKNLIEGMYDSAERENAQMCVAHMSSSDIYGKHEFKSTDLLARRKKTSKFDTDLVWNPAVTNKLFLKSKVLELGLKFNAFGKAREAAFTIPFAFECDTIVSSSKGTASYIIPYKDHGVSEFSIEHYLDAYEFIIKKAQDAFSNTISKSASDFDRKELKKRYICYIDEVFSKEITVLLYSYYRHFWSLSDEKIKEYTDIIRTLIEKLSNTGKKKLLSANKDIFYDGKLIDNKAEMAKNPKVTVCVGKSEKKGHLHKERMLTQVSSIFNQTMPCFELFVDKRLEDIFPEQWRGYPNVTFVEADNLGEFKDLALERCRTKYIMFHDGFVMLNPKILMRHYNALSGKEKYGFTTSPLTQFDGKRTKEYSFSDLSFYSDMTRTRITEESNMYALDLFFCNKLFRKEHLDGIRFSFSDNPIRDMYKLYKHCKFKKLSHRGAYLPYTEEDALNYLKSEQATLPTKFSRLYKKYKFVYFTSYTLKKHRGNLISFFGKIKRFILSAIAHFLVSLFSKMKICNRVFFYSIRSNENLAENIKYVSDACNARKVIFAKMYPHSSWDIAKIKFYMLTSKVIVTNDYMSYLRSVRLRPEQKVIQVWHASGAFKRFGLDAPSKLSRIEEYNTHSQYSDVIVSSEYVRQFYAHAFGVDIDVVKALGSPRTDSVADPIRREENRKQIVSRHPLLKNKKIYIYFPTVREEDDSLLDFDPKIDWAQLNDELDDDEVFIISRHPEMKKEFFKDAFYPRVKDYTFETLPTLLSVADVIITDYASIIFDASILDMPMVFYCPDYDEYERDFYLDYEKDLPGKIITDSDILLENIRMAYNSERDSQKLKDFRVKEVGACDGHSTQRVVNLIECYLK